MLSEAHPGPGLPYLELRPQAGLGAGPWPTVVCLHGYGAEKGDLTGLAAAIGDTRYAYLFPDAPALAFDGTDPTRRAWYERGGYESPEGVALALEALDQFFAGVAGRGLHGPFVLLGFSQGGAVALRYGLPRPGQFAGVACLSGSLRRTADLTPTLPPRRDLPVHLSHGTGDTVVEPEVTRAVARYLQEQGYRPEVRFYGAGHQITPQQVANLSGWLRGVFQR